MVNETHMKGPGDFDPPDDDARDEWIAERANALTDERVKRDNDVQAALQDLLWRDDDGETAVALRRFVMAENRQDADAELRAFLMRWVRHSVHEDAEADAAQEWERNEAGAGEMRDEQRLALREANREY